MTSSCWGYDQKSFFIPLPVVFVSQRFELSKSSRSKTVAFAIGIGWTFYRLKWSRVVWFSVGALGSLQLGLFEEREPLDPLPTRHFPYWNSNNWGVLIHAQAASSDVATPSPVHHSPEGVLDFGRARFSSSWAVKCCKFRDRGLVCVSLCSVG